MNQSYIIEMGLANPPYRLKQTESAQVMAKLLGYDARATKRLERIYKKTDIEYRHTVLNTKADHLPVPLGGVSERLKIYEKNACSLALAAIREGINPHFIPKITHLITVSCTGMYAPGLDIELLMQLQLSPHIERTCINFMGCYGAFNALKVADAICHKDARAFVLIVCVEFCSLHFQPINSEDNLIANALFADGAACALIHSEPCGEKNLNLTAFRSGFTDYEKKAMTWFIGNHGFDIKLSSYVPMILNENVKALVHPLLAFFQLTLEEIDYFAIHPGGKDILIQIEKALCIPTEKNKDAHEVLKNYGNMSSPTILFVLKKLLNRLTAKNNEQKILAMAFGPGLTIETGLFEIHIQQQGH